MKNHTMRTAVIWIVLVLGIINIVPTVGWMCLSDETREAKLAKWKDEDEQYAKTKQTVLDDMIHGAKRWAEFDRDRVIDLGLDLQGGIHMVIGIQDDKLDPARRADYEKRGYSQSDIRNEVQQIVLQQIQRRVNDFQTKEPIIQTLGNSQIQVQLPGEKDVERARELIKKTAFLTFHIVAGQDKTGEIFKKLQAEYGDDLKAPFLKRSMESPSGLCVPLEYYEHVNEIVKEATEKGLLPEDKIIAFGQKPKAYDPDQTYKLYVMDKEPIIDGNGLVRSLAAPDDQNPPYFQIIFEFNAAYGEKFAKATEANKGNPMAIVLDGVVCSAPTIRDRISTNGQISGKFDGEEARDLAIALNSGSMVVPIKEEFTSVVGPSLGRESVHDGVISFIIGTGVVALFMVGYYLWGGLLSIIALIVNGILCVASLAYFNMTLTMPGIAGLILTVGMAVDANVLIFERIREELRLGHSLDGAVDIGFKRAAATILDSNITTLIAGVVLMQFGTGPIQGFAITLSIGIVWTVYAGLVVCRALFDFCLEHKIITDLKMLNAIPHGLKIPFIETAWFWLSTTMVMVLASYAIFGYRCYEGTAFGVDFTEGTNIVLQMPKDRPTNAEEVLHELENAGFNSPVVQVSGDPANNTFLIRVADVAKGTEIPVAPAAAPVEAPAAAPEAPAAAPVEAPAAAPEAPAAAPEAPAAAPEAPAAAPVEAPAAAPVEAPAAAPEAPAAAPVEAPAAAPEAPAAAPVEAPAAAPVEAPAAAPVEAPAAAPEAPVAAPVEAPAAAPEAPVAAPVEAPAAAPASSETAPVEAAPQGNNASAEEEATPPAPATETTGALAVMPVQEDSIAYRIQDACAKLTPNGNRSDVVIISEQSVGPAVGKQLRLDALYAVVASMIFIILYVAFRFKPVWAFSSVLALVHDVSIALGFMCLIGRPVSMTSIAAYLTIIGYSINDTIVVFDRIREELPRQRGKGMSLMQIMNYAINITLSRTLLTSLTVFMCVIVLCIFGGETILDFSLAMLVGVVVGTYSSIFVASAMVYYWQVWRGQDADYNQMSPLREKAAEVEEELSEEEQKKIARGSGGSKSRKTRPRVR